MTKRVKLDDLLAIFISRDDDNVEPRYTFEYFIHEEHIVNVLVPWFLVAKKYGVPKDIVKLIANLLPNRYYRCPVWKFIKHCLDCIIPSINMHMRIYRSYWYAIPSRQRHFDFYAHIIEQQCSTRQYQTFAKEGTRVTIHQEHVSLNFYFQDMNRIIIRAVTFDEGVVTIDEKFLKTNGFL